MRSNIISAFKRLKKEDDGVTDFVLFGHAVIASNLDRRQIERCMRQCVKVTNDFTWKEAIEHFHRISWLAPEKRLGRQKHATSYGSVKPIQTT